MKIGGNAACSFLTFGQRWLNGQNHKGLKYNGPVYFIEERGMQQKAGNIAYARGMASKSKKQRVKLLGAENEEALMSTAMLARAYSLEGRWEEAEQLQVLVMEASKAKLCEAWR
ncbi:hypothetical protein N7522_002935 [Penicillium canescens]|nr:hypothetical protein N7522_002935 [Penicillium canescens]